MKSIFTIYLIFIHAFMGVVIVETDIISRMLIKLDYGVIDEITPHYRTMLAFHRRIDKNILDNSVIFIGDSLVQGLSVSSVFPKSVNFGIGQDTTYGVLSRLQFYSSIPRAKLIVIAIGVNDLRRRSNDEIIDNFIKIIESIPKKVPILLSAILPVDEVASHLTGYNARITRINDELKEIYLNQHAFHFIDASKILIDARGNLDNGYHIGDGIHLNELGNGLWIDKLSSAVENIVAQNQDSIKNEKYK